MQLSNYFEGAAQMGEAIHVQMDLQDEVNYVQQISWFPLRV